MIDACQAVANLLECMQKLADALVECHDPSELILSEFELGRLDEIDGNLSELIPIIREKLFGKPNT